MSFSSFLQPLTHALAERVLVPFFFFHHRLSRLEGHVRENRIQDREIIHRRLDHSRGGFFNFCNGRVLKAYFQAPLPRGYDEIHYSARRDAWGGGASDKNLVRRGQAISGPTPYSAFCLRSHRALWPLSSLFSPLSAKCVIADPTSLWYCCRDARKHRAPAQGLHDSYIITI